MVLLITSLKYSASSNIRNHETNGRNRLITSPKLCAYSGSFPSSRLSWIQRRALGGKNKGFLASTKVGCCVADSCLNENRAVENPEVADPR